jgi:uncharacterized protein with NRDE domain
MCLIAIAYQVNPTYPLIIAANRDEFYNRPTAPLSFWQDHPDILAGRDLKGLGTWLGINRKGKIAAVTNYREPESLSSATSRGNLVTRYLLGETSPASYLEKIKRERNRYNGFNLIVGGRTGLYWYSNRSAGVKEISPGIHAISNHLLDTAWPKVEKVRSRMAAILGEENGIDPEAFFRMLRDDQRPPEQTLPDTGIGLEWEKILSPAFIKSTLYGTRSSSVLFFDGSGRILFMERHFNGSDSGETRRFTLQT